MRNFLKITVAVFMLGLLAGCSTSEDGVCADTGIFCASGGTIEACCTDTSCRYVLDGVSYPCDGVNCDAAAVTVVNVCNGGTAKADDGAYTKLLEDLLIEKSDNIILRFEAGKVNSGE